LFPCSTSRSVGGVQTWAGGTTATRAQAPWHRPPRLSRSAWRTRCRPSATSTAAGSRRRPHAPRRPRATPASAPSRHARRACALAPRLRSRTLSAVLAPLARLRHASAFVRLLPPAPRANPATPRLARIPPHRAPTRRQPSPPAPPARPISRLPRDLLAGARQGSCHACARATCPPSSRPAPAAPAPLAPPARPRPGTARATPAPEPARPRPCSAATGGQPRYLARAPSLTGRSTSRGRRRRRCSLPRAARPLQAATGARRRGSSGWRRG
jgi:hypothetical protein